MKTAVCILMKCSEKTNIEFSYDMNKQGLWKQVSVVA